MRAASDTGRARNQLRRPGDHQPRPLRSGTKELERLARRRDAEGIKAKFMELVPSYHPNGHRP